MAGMIRIHVIHETLDTETVGIHGAPLLTRVDTAGILIGMIAIRVSRGVHVIQVIGDRTSVITEPQEVLVVTTVALEETTEVLVEMIVVLVVTTVALGEMTEVRVATTVVLVEMIVALGEMTVALEEMTEVLVEMTVVRVATIVVHGEMIDVGTQVDEMRTRDVAVPAILAGTIEVRV